MPDPTHFPSTYHLDNCLEVSFLTVAKLSKVQLRLLNFVLQNRFEPIRCKLHLQLDKKLCSLNTALLCCSFSLIRDPSMVTIHQVRLDCSVFPNNIILDPESRLFSSSKDAIHVADFFYIIRVVKVRRLPIRSRNFPHIFPRWLRWHVVERRLRRLLLTGERVAEGARYEVGCYDIDIECIGRPGCSVSSGNRFTWSGFVAMSSCWFSSGVKLQHTRMMHERFE